jgi:hypothetical protein
MPRSPWMDLQEAAEMLAGENIRARALAEVLWRGGVPIQAKKSGDATRAEIDTFLGTKRLKICPGNVLVLDGIKLTEVRVNRPKLVEALQDAGCDGAERLFASPPLRISAAALAASARPPVDRPSLAGRPWLTATPYHLPRARPASPQQLPSPEWWNDGALQISGAATTAEEVASRPAVSPATAAACTDRLDPRVVVIRAAIDNNKRPGKTIPWGKFHRELLETCKAQETDRGFGLRQIQLLFKAEIKRRG